ncbi:hypothetical protein EDB84DRAFT_1446578 [Lactarius hengduanensis]|nr:hypothetical protein EDB84DRAFT_1446578 [Lactarius hengduanensis]
MGSLRTKTALGARRRWPAYGAGKRLAKGIGVEWRYMGMRGEGRRRCQAEERGGKVLRLMAKSELVRDDTTDMASQPCDARPRPEKTEKNTPRAQSYPYSATEGGGWRAMSRSAAEEITAFIRDHISTNFEVHLTGHTNTTPPTSQTLPSCGCLFHHHQHIHILQPPPPEPDAPDNPSPTLGYGYVGVRVRVALENPRVTPGNPYLPPPRPPRHNCHLDSANSAPPQHNATPTCHRLDCTATYLGDVNRHPDPTSTGTRWRHIPITRTTHLWQGCPNTCDDDNDDRQQ